MFDDDALSLTAQELEAMSAIDLQAAAGRAWRADNNAGWGETPEDYAGVTIDPNATVNDLARALDGELVLRSNNDQEIAVYLVGREIVGVGDAHGLWLVRLGYTS